MLILSLTVCGGAWLRCCPCSRAAPPPPGAVACSRPDGACWRHARAADVGVIHVLRTGVAWRDVPAESVGCSGVTAWHRLRGWTEAGTWPRLHAALLGSCDAPACWTWTTVPRTAHTPV
ncbi:transposase [Streptomyces broussonetiae]